MRSTSRLSLAAALILLGAAPVLAQTATTPAAPASGTNRPAAQAATPANPGGAVTQQGQVQRPAVSGQHGTTGSTHAAPSNGQRPATVAPSASSTTPAAPMGQAPRATN